MPYKAKTLAGAQRRVRELEKLREQQSATLEKYARDRELLARLAADGPTFNNPLEVFAAKRLRDSILNHMGLNPDGTFIREANPDGTLSGRQADE